MAARDMVARHSDYDETRDFIPTPPFATRALYEHVAPELRKNAPQWSAYDPAAGEGHMVRVFGEYGHPFCYGSDLEPRSESLIWGRNFLEEPVSFVPDIIVTNPPYKHANEFVLRALDEAKRGVAMLVRVQALEGQRRYASLYSVRPPTQVGFFSDRVPFKVGRVVRKAPKMFFHVWLWWNKYDPTPRPPLWIPPDVQQRLEKDQDYE